MTPDRDRERQLDAILTAAEDDAGALRAAIRQLYRGDSDLIADLGLTAQLREVGPAKAEIDAARLRVGQRLTHDIFTDPISGGVAKPRLRPLRLSEPPDTTLPASMEPPWPVTSPSPTLTLGGTALRTAHGHKRSMWRRAILAATVAAALFLALCGGLAAASAQSLPESPLYSVKRIEESILLALPLGDDAHAHVLSMAAERRLAEAQSEANEQHDAEAMALLRDYDSDVRQLIMLAASVSAHGGDNSSITAQIAQVVEAEQVLQQHASARGQTAFSQALGASANDIAEALKQQHITLPSADGSNAKGGGKGHSGSPGATPTVGPSPTPPGSSGSHRGGHGHKNGNSRSGDSAGN